MDTTQKQKSEAKRCKLYIDKYLSMLKSNNLCDQFFFFENILLPSSNFMLYYKVKAPEATLLSSTQKEKLKDHLLKGNYFKNIRNTKLVYGLYPEETLAFYKEKLVQMDSYDDDPFDNYSYQISYHLKFVLEEIGKWNKDTELLYSIFSSYSCKDTASKEKIFKRLVEKIEEK